MNRTRRWSIGSLIALLLVALAPAQAVQLKTGELLMGEVEEPTDEGLTLKRFDNGGTLRLRWDQLSPASSERLKQLFSLSVDDETEVLVDADIIEYVLPTGGLERAVGRIID